jgi:hypothetical protein
VFGGLPTLGFEFFYLPDFLLVHRQELNVGFGEVFTEVRAQSKVFFSSLLPLRPSVKQDSKSVTEYY